MTWYEKQKEQAEEIRKKNRLISDNEIEAIVSTDLFKTQERYVFKTQMLEEIKKEKEYIYKVLESILKKGIEENIPIGYEENGQLIIPSQLNTEEYRYGKTLELSNIVTEMQLDNPYESLDYLNAFVRKLNKVYQQLCEQEEGIKKGDEGERTIERELKLYKGKYHYRENVILPANDIGGETSETDVYIVTAKAIFVCEVKNWGKLGRTICISKDGQWYIKGQNTSLKSPIQQNTRHCLATERYLKAYGINDYKIIPLVIIANNEVRLENLGNNNIIRISELYNFIEGLNIPEKYTEKQQKEVLDLFDNSKVSERKFKILSVSEKSKQIDKQIEQIFLWIKDEKKWKSHVISYLNNISEKKVKKKKMSLICAIATLIALIIGIMIYRNRPEEINLKKYIVCDVDGYSGSGTITEVVDKETLEDDIDYHSKGKYGIRTLEDIGITVEAEPSSGLANGDIVNVRFHYNDKNLKKYYPRIHFTGKEGKKIKITGLKEKGGSGIIIEPSELSESDLKKIRDGVQQAIENKDYTLIFGSPDYSEEREYPGAEDVISNISIDKNMKFYKINTKFEKNNLVVSFELDMTLNGASDEKRGETYHFYGMCKFQDLKTGKDGCVDMEDGLSNLYMPDLNTDKDYIDLDVVDEAVVYTVTANE